MLRKKNKAKSRTGGKTNFWLFSIVEFLIVILGILIALQIDNWNENRKERQFEMALLEEFRENLSSDLKGIVFDISYLESIKTSNSIVLEFLEGDAEYSDTLDQHFGNLSNGVLFVYDISTYETAKSVGLTIINNHELRRKISYLYSGRYRYTEKLIDAHNQNSIEFLLPSMNRNLNISKPLISASPIDKIQVKSDNEFSASIKYNTTTLEYLINSYTLLRNSITEILDLIDKELE